MKQITFLLIFSLLALTGLAIPGSGLPMPTAVYAAPGGQQGGTTEIIDVAPGYWAYNEIISLISIGVISADDGADGNMFEPDRAITRGEFAKLLCLTLEMAITGVEELGLPITAPKLADPATRYNASDLSKKDPIYPYAASLRSILRPYNALGAEPEFKAGSPLLRSDAAVALAKLLGKEDKKTEGPGLSQFTDADAIENPIQRNAAAQLANLGILRGSADGELVLGGDVSRAEACVLLYRLLRTVKWGEAVGLPLLQVYIPDADSGFYDAFFDGAVFVGDSVTLGLRNYVLNQRVRGADKLGKARFNAVVSYSIRAAAADDYRKHKINLSWQGRNMSIEDCLHEMGANELYMMLGINEGLGANLTYYRDLYQKALDKVAKRNPGITIRVQSCTPVAKKRDNGNISNANVDRFNAMLFEMCEANGYDYVDISTPMKGEDNCLRPDYTSDKDVHMSNMGCEVWIDALRAFARDKYIDGGWAPDTDPSGFPGIWMDTVD